MTKSVVQICKTALLYKPKGRSWY